MESKKDRRNGRSIGEFECSWIGSEVCIKLVDKNCFITCKDLWGATAEDKEIDISQRYWRSLISKAT
jgi:hypothetical protein